MPPAQRPIKVYESTKQRIRHGSLLASCDEAEFVDRAVAEYVERHTDDFYARLDRAREALLGGPAATVAHAVGATEADIEGIGGSTGQPARGLG